MHVDDVIGGGNQTFDRTMTTVRKEFDFGAWDVGNFRFKGRHISQMPNGEIVRDMEPYKHELEQIDVSKADKTKPERVLNSKEHTQFRGGVGSLGWFVDHCSPQLSFQLAELRRKQASPTVQDLLKLNKVIRAAKVIESKARSEVFQWNIFASWVFMMRHMQILEVRHSRVISFLQYMQASRIVAFLCLC